MQRPISFRYRILISSPTPAWSHTGLTPTKNLERIIAHISHLDPPPAFVILTGDLISDDDPQSYRHLKLLTDCLPSPVYFTMGNHDLRRPFRHVVLGEESPGSEPHYYTFDAAGYRFVVLDSLVEGEVAGALDAAQLAWLDATLTNGSQQPTVVFMHHPPIPTGVDCWTPIRSETGTIFWTSWPSIGRCNGFSSDTFTCRYRLPIGVCSLPACRPARTSLGIPSPLRRSGPAPPVTGLCTSLRGG